MATEKPGLPIRVPGALLQGRREQLSRAEFQERGERIIREFMREHGLPVAAARIGAPAP